MKRFALQTKREGGLTTLAIFTVLGASLLCPSNAFASVRMYALWYPYTNSGQGAAVAHSGATIGGQFAVRVVVQPEQGEGTIVSASIIQQSIRELTNVHPVTSGQLAEFQRVDPNPQYGDPTGNVVVLESPFINLAGHNGTYQIDVTVSYVVATGNPPPNNWRTINPPPVSMTLTMNNLVLVDSRSEPYFVWKPLEVAPPPQPRNVLIEDPVPIGPTVPFSVQIQHAQSGVCTLRLEIFTSENNQTPILVKEFTNVPRPGVWQWEWDGKLADGTTAPRGIYLYRLSAEAYVPTLPDRDSNRSAFLESLRAYDENNEPILYAEYWGYDDKSTPEDESDDEHLYFVRWYVLRDSLNTNASSGRIWLFNPDLNPVYSWDMTALRCLEHNEATDGLRADSTGIKHGVIVPVPVSVMPLGGDYRFLLQVKDDHVAYEKAHRLKPALELNAKTPREALHIWLDGRTDGDIRSRVNWDKVAEAFFWLAGLPARVHREDTAGNREERYFGAPFFKVDYHALSDTQKRNSSKRTVIVQTRTSGQTTHPGATQEGKLSPENPAVSVISTWSVENFKPEGGDLRWGYTNAVIHEITHVVMDDDTHCSSASSCVWRERIRPYFYFGWGNLLQFVKPDGVRWQYWSPWHSLDEIVTMQRNLGVPPYRP